MVAQIRDMPSGSRFWRCAFQVNTYAYLKRHGHATKYASAEDYNKALVEACVDNGIEVIGVTDHYRIREASGLIRAARAADIIVFPGFEAVTREGVHILCLFDPETPLETVQNPR